MKLSYPLGEDLVSSERVDDAVALESFTSDLAQNLTQGPLGPPLCPYFNPANIIVENGLLYATIYVCKASNGTDLAQRLAMWLSSLKDTDHVHLTVTSLVLDVPLFAMLDLLAALSSTKAKIDIHLDQIVADSLAYFYLAANNITKGYAGALFIPSYAEQRSQDTSGPWRAMYDFYKMIVDTAVQRNILTEEEGERLHSGSPVAVPFDRFD